MELRCFAIVATLLVTAEGANILLLLGVPSKSHQIWFSTLLNGLSDRGHNLTVLAADMDSNPPANTHYIYLEGVYDYLYNTENVNLIALHKDTVTQNVATLYNYGSGSCLGIIKSNGLQQLLNYPDDYKFNIVLYDYTLGPCVLGFLHKFNYPPLVSLTAFNNPSYTSEIVGGHNYYAYIPYCSLSFGTDMSFVQRLQNLYIHFYDYYYRNYIFLPAIDAMVKPIFANDCPKVSQLELQTTIALVNINPAIGYPEPLPPNVIPIGGLHITKPKPVSKDIEQFIKLSRKGTVLFSLGTNLKSNEMGANKQIIFLKAFAKMPDYHFIWKFETDNLPMALPKNVMVKKWLSQNDILAHKGCKAFMTHSGSLSTQEASWYGVPMVTIPFFVDQIRNSHHSVQAGVAERITFENVSVEMIVENVRKVLEDPSYQKNAKLRSIRFQDQPEKPLVRAIWWIEYVLRNPKPDHLSSPVLKLGFFAANIYDMILFLLVISGITLLVVYKVIAKTFSGKVKSEKFKRQ